MHKYFPPKPIIIKLNDSLGFELRKKAAEYISTNLNQTGAERGSTEEQGFGALTEIVIRNKLGLPDIKAEDHPIDYDILTPLKVKIDVKCRGGKLPFKEVYDGSDEIPREAKHNFFARQVYDENLKTDIYLMTHLETPKDRNLPGTSRQKKWILYICGWVSKKRVKRDGVYLSRGSLTEQGKTWFTYRGQEIEFYNKNLNGLSKIEDIFTIEKGDILKDEQKKGSLNLTSVDAIRITYDLIGRGILQQKHAKFIRNNLGVNKQIDPILHPNQYFHLIQWLAEMNQVDKIEIKKLEKIMQKQLYKGI